MKKIILSLSLFFVANSFAQDKAVKIDTKPPQMAYQKGLHYSQLDPVFDTDNKEQVVIYEFFGYKCPHCSSFEPFMKSLHERVSKNVKIVRVPVIFQPGWDILAKAYYTAETMGIIENTHQAMFDAIHKKHMRFSNLDEVAQWYADNFNVDKKAFISTANSFLIDSKIRQSNRMMQAMKVMSTPMLIIDGKFKPEVKALGSNDALIEMAASLANKEAQQRGLEK